MSSDSSQARPYTGDELEEEAPPQNYWKNPKPTGIPLFTEICESTEYQYLGWLIREDEKKVVFAGEASYLPGWTASQLRYGLPPLPIDQRRAREKYGLVHIGNRLVERYGDNNVLLHLGFNSIIIYIDAEAYKNGVAGNRPARAEHPNGDRLRPGRDRYNDMRTADFWVRLAPRPLLPLQVPPFLELAPKPKVVTLYNRYPCIYSAVLIREDEEAVVLGGDLYDRHVPYDYVLAILRQRFGANFFVRPLRGTVVIHIDADTFYGRPKHDDYDPSSPENDRRLCGHGQEYIEDGCKGGDLLMDYFERRKEEPVREWTVIDKSLALI